MPIQFRTRRSKVLDDGRLRTTEITHACLHPTSICIHAKLCNQMMRLKRWSPVSSSSKTTCSDQVKASSEIGALVGFALSFEDMMLISWAVHVTSSYWTYTTPVHALPVKIQLEQSSTSGTMPKGMETNVGPCSLSKRNMFGDQ